jgi:hypothetical protein
MNASRIRRFVIAATIVGATSSGAVLASSAFADSPHRPAAPQHAPGSSQWTPNDCVRMNQGDYIACNVGNSGRGDLPYHTVSVR